MPVCRVRLEEGVVISPNQLGSFGREVRSLVADGGVV